MHALPRPPSARIFFRSEHFEIDEPLRPNRCMDRVTLSRIEIEWLVACYHDSARLMPRDVRERLEFLGLIDDQRQLTAAGTRWA
jgi:hypothetical protein